MSQRLRIWSRRERRAADGTPLSPAITVTAVIPDGVELSLETRQSLLALAKAATDEIERAAVKTLLDKAEAELGGGGDMSLIDWIEAQGRQQ